VPVLLGIIAISVAVFYWIYRANHAVKAAKELNRDTKGLQRKVKHTVQGLIGTPLQRVNDVRLAAVILMIQLVRTGAPLTAAERNAIYEIMDRPLQIADRQALFERAWQLTDQGRAFTPVADELLPLLTEKLTPSERLEFTEMLTRVANAYGEASDLQREAIVRLKRRLQAGGTDLVKTRLGR
jgi:uncharacterized tellurite resistance protein B-like protein